MLSNNVYGTRRKNRTALTKRYRAVLGIMKKDYIMDLIAKPDNG